MSPLVLFLCYLAAISQGYEFNCLDNCICNTDDETIHCNNGGRKKLVLPKSRLRGFSIIGMTYNDIEYLPPEDELKKKFPDLRVIDVENNSNFNCTSLATYRRIRIYSDCVNTTHPKLIKGRLPDITEPDTCGMTCIANYHYEALQKYIAYLWNELKQKYENFDKQQFLEDIKKYIKDFTEKIKTINN
uniref:LRRNT domain-containing protein n=1 Tax=Syphacia muris TaxID=451379 RepID=A0A0N5AB59_9BILA